MLPAAFPRRARHGQTSARARPPRRAPIASVAAYRDLVIIHVDRASGNGVRSAGRSTFGRRRWRVCVRFGLRLDAGGHVSDGDPAEPLAARSGQARRLRIAGSVSLTGPANCARWIAPDG